MERPRLARAVWPVALGVCVAMGCGGRISDERQPADDPASGAADTGVTYEATYEAISNSRVHVVARDHVRDVATHLVLTLELEGHPAGYAYSGVDTCGWTLHGVQRCRGAAVKYPTGCEAATTVSGSVLVRPNVVELRLDLEFPSFELGPRVAQLRGTVPWVML
ncbi:MAG: hypothetical protein HYV09_40850 [Deltaproteobacteria bacterium]|nr:hypothetical protein [Deltaproteobacteria bacterium]